MIMMSRLSNVVDVDVVDVVTMLLMPMTQPACCWPITGQCCSLITLACGSSAEDGLLCNWVCVLVGGGLGGCVRVRSMCVLKGFTGGIVA